MVKPRENRVPIMMSEAELQSVDDWRYANRVATRSEAIRRLCQIGLVFGPLINEAFNLAEKAKRADMASREIVSNAWEAFNVDPKISEHSKEKLRDLAELWLSPVDPSMELYLHAQMMTKVFNALRSGETPIEEGLEQAKSETQMFESVRNFTHAKNETNS